LPKGDVIQDTDAVFATDLLDPLVPEGPIARAENVGAAENSRLQDRVVVRIAHYGRNVCRHFHHKRGGLQSRELISNGLFR
jgi:hypothetical protein